MEGASGGCWGGAEGLEAMPASVDGYGIAVDCPNLPKCMVSTAMLPTGWGFGCAGVLDDLRLWSRLYVRVEVRTDARSRGTVPRG
jgi:hypothetical protein